MNRLKYAPLALLVLFALVLPARASWVSPFISEIHYDNAGPDVGEFVAVSGPGGLDLQGWQIVLYNGSNGLPYRTVELSGAFAPGDDWTEAVWPAGGIQNGPDAVALFSPLDGVIDFVAYEGAINAMDGVAAGLTATQLPVVEDGRSAAGQSLQRVGSADEWRWLLAVATPGELNPGLGGFAAAATVPLHSAAALWLAGIAAWMLWSMVMGWRGARAAPAMRSRGCLS